MAVVQMQKFYLYGLHLNRKAILEMLQRKGVVEPTDLDADDILHKKDTTSQILQFKEELNRISKAIEILEEYNPSDKKPFYADVEKIDDKTVANIRRASGRILRDINEIIKISEIISKKKSEIEKNEIQKYSLYPWRDLDIPMNTTQTKYTKVYLGSFQGEWSTEDVVRAFEERDLPEPVVEIVNSSKMKTCLMLTFHKKSEEQAEQGLKELRFSSIGFDCENLTANEKIDQLKQNIKKLQEEIKQHHAQLKELSKKKREVEILHDCVESRSEKYRVLHQLGMTDKVFVMSGYIPKEKFEELYLLLEKKYDAYIEQIDPLPDEEPPVKLKNNAFSRPVESIVESYSMPTKEDIDPTGIMAFFYYFFFGMMFSDAGYGLLVVLVCGFLGFIKKDVKPSMKNSMRMFFYCGLSTLFWGIMYGSFFGNAVNVVSEGLFNSTVTLEPILFDPIEKPLELMFISIGFGLIHVLVGLGINFYCLCRNGHVVDAICDAGFWIIALSGAGVFAVGIFIPSALMKDVGLYMIIVGLAGIVITGGRKSKNIIGKCFLGVVHLYDITSYFSDLLSYSRLMALGLATGVIATMMNTIGSIMGFGVGGTILFVIVFIFGHAINFAINMLGAYVHTNRLQYVEFFGKFYEGGSKKFEPFSFKSKYIKLKEDK